MLAGNLKYISYSCLILYFNKITVLQTAKVLLRSHLLLMPKKCKLAEFECARLKGK